MGGLQQVQMSWQPSLLSQRRKTGPPIGLKNLGNSCYLNSVLQCLTYTPPLANFCLRSQHSSLCDSTSNGEKKRECPFCILEKRISRSLKVDLSLDTPVKIQSCLRIFAEHFRSGRQEDAHEFLRYVIDACHNTCLRLKKLRRKNSGAENGIGGGNTVVKEIFGGALQSQVKCLSCNAESNKVDEIMDISLDVLHSNSLKDAMHKFFQPEILDGSNKYKCENCKKLVAARKQMSVLQAPNILVIQLKRFEGIFGGKIDKAIAFEEVLVLSSFMSKSCQDLQPQYSLFGTIVHSGYSQESGHYYAYIKDAIGRWYCCNDSYVTLSTLQEVLSEKVYILFFSRSNQRPVSDNTSHAFNGVKSHDSSRNEELKNPMTAVPPKPAPSKTYSESSLRKDVSAGKLPSGPHVKFNINGNGSSISLASRNGNVDKVQVMESNADANGSVHLQKLDKENITIHNKNGLNKSNSEVFEDHAASSANKLSQNASSNSVKPLIHESNEVKPLIHESNGAISRSKTERGYDMSGSKRKLEEAHDLFSQHSLSKAKVERFKEELEQEASSALRSCGLPDKVYDFMHSRKRMWAEGSITSVDDLKRQLIADAKSTFILQIPETLKGDLVKRLQLFLQGK